MLNQTGTFLLLECVLLEDESFLSYYCCILIKHKIIAFFSYYIYIYIYALYIVMLSLEWLWA